MSIFEYFKTAVKYFSITIALLIALIIFYIFVDNFMREPSNFQKITSNQDFHILESESTGFMDPSLSMHFKTTPELMNAFILENKLQMVSKREFGVYSKSSEWLSSPGVVTYYENTDYINSHQEWMDRQVDLRHNKDKTEGFYSFWSK
jgi:hypothetical protein